MDYASYRQFRDELLVREQPLRLDCMNPAKALAKWSAESTRATSRTCTPSQTIDAWSRAAGMNFDIDRMVLASGVRELLSATLGCGVEAGQELWLPADVYPVYWELAERAAICAQAFATIPSPDWSFLARTSERAVIVVPIPLSPLGRQLTDAEEAALSQWVLASKYRRLVIDGVYTFDFASASALANRLARGKRSVVLWSCSKSWLRPGELGVALAPPWLASELRVRVSAPNAATLGRITTLLEDRPDLPRRQQDAFRREWERLKARLRSALPDWEPPATGYFAVVRAPFEQLLERGMLAVPATVFGSPRRDLSIVTCLHDLLQNEEGAQGS